MANRDIIVVGASAGGVEALKQLAAGLPPSLPAAVFVVLHLPAHAPSMLAEILHNAGSMPARWAVDGDPFRVGTISVAPVDHHLLLGASGTRIVRGPRENRHRPAVDPLFRTAARNLGRRVIGVILTGSLDDGTAGLQMIKRHGGLAVVQDPLDALVPGMPQSAIEHVAVDHVAPMRQMADLLTRLATGPAGVEDGPAMEPGGDVLERDLAQMDEERERSGPSIYSCPECHGTLWEVADGDLMRYRCRVGHAYSAEALLSDQEDMVEAAIWAALRGLEERLQLTRRLRLRAQASAFPDLVGRYGMQVRDLEEHIRVLRGLLGVEG